MGTLNNINRCSQSTFNSIINGTHATETYDDNSLYAVTLDDPITLGESGTYLSINSDNQLVLDDLPTSKITSGTFADARIASAATWNAKLGTSDVVNNVTSTSTTNPLSANQGRVLQNEINNLKNIGRFLAILDSSTGTVSSQPSGSVGDTYDYKVGDYYRIGNSGTYTPKGTATFTIDSTSGSSNFEQGSTTYNIGDVLYCSNLTSTTSTWVKQSSSGGGTVQDVQVDGTTILSGGIANLTSSNVPSIPLSKVSDITASYTEVNYTQGVTSNIQTQLNAKASTSDLPDVVRL